MTHVVLREARYPREEKDLDAGRGDLVSQHVLGVPAAEASLGPAIWEQMAEERVWAWEACGVEKAVPCFGVVLGLEGQQPLSLAPQLPFRVEALVFHVYSQTAM